MKRVVCTNCDSDAVEESMVDHVYECLDCGEVFEDEEFDLEYLREKRIIRQKRLNMQES